MAKYVQFAWWVIKIKIHRVTGLIHIAFDWIEL
jgi:hypothetical protein